MRVYQLSLRSEAPSLEFYRTLEGGASTLSEIRSCGRFPLGIAANQ
jgi:hypothetical protein